MLYVNGVLGMLAELRQWVRNFISSRFDFVAYKPFLHSILILVSSGFIGVQRLGTRQVAADKAQTSNICTLHTMEEGGNVQKYETARN